MKYLLLLALASCGGDEFLTVQDAAPAPTEDTGVRLDMIPDVRADVRIDSQEIREDAGAEASPDVQEDAQPDIKPDVPCVPLTACDPTKVQFMGSGTTCGVQPDGCGGTVGCGMCPPPDCCTSIFDKGFEQFICSGGC